MEKNEYTGFGSSVQREGGCAHGRMDDKNGPGEIKLIEGFYVRLLCSAFIPGPLLLRVVCLFCRVF